jgi:hypothetical protein
MEYRGAPGHHLRLKERRFFPLWVGVAGNRPSTIISGIRVSRLAPIVELISGAGVLIFSL